MEKRPNQANHRFGAGSRVGSYVKQAEMRHFLKQVLGDEKSREKTGTGRSSQHSPLKPVTLEEMDHSHGERNQCERILDHRSKKPEYEGSRRMRKEQKADPDRQNPGLRP